MRWHLAATCMILALMASRPAWAAEGAIPPDYRGFWGAGGCKVAQFFLNIEESGIQGYGPDKRTPFGNWDVRIARRTADGIAIDTPETNSGKPFQMEFAKAKEGWLHIKMRSPDGADAADFESCSPHTQ